MEIKLKKRVKFAGDVLNELLKAEWDIEAAIAFVNAIPDADCAEVVHAEWRLDGFCTNCGHRADVQSIGFNCTGGTRIEYKRTKFCPECGAKMDGERRKIIEADL